MFDLYAMVDYNFQAWVNTFQLVVNLGLLLGIIHLGAKVNGMRESSKTMRLQDGSSKELSFKITERDTKSSHDLQRAMEA